VISKTIQFTLAVAVLGIFSFMPHSFAQIDDPKTDRFYVKGIADQTGQFAGQHVRILGDNEKATIIRDTQNGMAVIKMTVAAFSSCDNMVHRICLNGVVSDVKNTGSPHIGDMLRLVIDTSGKKQSMSYLTGKLAGSIVSISLKDPKAYNEYLLSEKPEIPQKFMLIPEKRSKVSLANQYVDDGMTEAMQKAREFAVSQPTFAFDGIQQSLDVNLVSIIQSKTMPLYIVQVSFDSKHSGYGDRSGQALKDTITHHTMKVFVSDYGIGSAIIDGVWDEFNQNWQK